MTRACEVDQWKAPCGMIKLFLSPACEVDQWKAPSGLCWMVNLPTCVYLLQDCAALQWLRGQQGNISSHVRLACDMHCLLYEQEYEMDYLFE